MIGVHDLPAVNAKPERHRSHSARVGLHVDSPQAAFRPIGASWSARSAVSILFLICYLIYHAQVGSVPYPVAKLSARVYLSILFTHVGLAATVPFLASITLYRGWKGTSRSIAVLPYGLSHLALRQYHRGNCLPSALQVLRMSSSGGTLNGVSSYSARSIQSLPSMFLNESERFHWEGRAGAPSFQRQIANARNGRNDDRI